MLEVTSVDHGRRGRTDRRGCPVGGFADRAALRRWTDQRGAGTLYRIGIRLAGPDPRVALRAAADLTDAELAALEQKLDRMDRAAPEPWTRAVLGQIRDRPAIVSTELAAAAGQPRDYYKLRVRRLKALGLTESLEIGYRLSPRGAAYLTRREAGRG